MYLLMQPGSKPGILQDPIGVFFMLLDSLKLKSPSSIYFLGLTQNPQDCNTTVSFGATPCVTVWQHSASLGLLCSKYDDMDDLEANETDSREGDHSCYTGNVTTDGKYLGWGR